VRLDLPDAWVDLEAALDPPRRVGGRATRVADQLGVAPSPATRALYEELLAQT
jgi:hypothetical protein